MTHLFGPAIREKLSYPRLQKNSDTMEFASCELSETILENRGQWQAAPQDRPAVEPEWILAPALAADSWGHRLGHGRGHYDRYFNSHPEARRVGTIPSAYLTANFPPQWIEAHDVPLEVLWTESGIYRTPNYRPQSEKLFAAKEYLK
jgi:5,10-methenyltetrahydrofolate synthetase